MNHEPRAAGNKKRLFRHIFSWCIVLGGLVAGTYVLALFGAIPFFLRWPDWLYQTGMGVYGATFLVASLVGTWNRRRAGLIYVWVIPFVVLCVSFEEFSVSEKCLLAGSACSIFAVLGIFWLLTHRWLWPAVVNYRTWSPRLRWIAALVTSVVLLGAVAIGAIVVVIRGEIFGDCFGTNPLARRDNPWSAVFTARVIHSDPYFGVIGAVQEHFWGIPSYHKLVFLKADKMANGELYLIEARRDSGLLTHSILPVVSLHCGRSIPVRDAVAELRAIRSGPPKPGVRLTGRILRDYTRQYPISGIKALVTGGGVTAETISDKEGIYDVSGLPTGQYWIRIDGSHEGDRNTSCSSRELESGDIFVCNLRIH